ncbi:MAG: sugar phosphate isomerase/epimerase family protein, partial [Ardenticatenaceae bacterium]
MQLRFDDLVSFIDAARGIGFYDVELSHVVTPEMIGALPRRAAGAVRILHHPCPNPGGVSDVADPDESRRAAAVQHVKRTIEWAARLGAKVVLVHLGVVSGDRRWENALRARWLQGERAAPTYGRLAAFVEGLRAAQVERHLEAARRSLADLVPFAESHEVSLGFENGEWIMSIPTQAEARHLLETFDTPALGLWVDPGHATILQRLGFSTFLEWVQLAPDRLLGLHYHDVNGLRDHLIPGKGTIDWRALAAHVPSHALPTCEFDWYYAPEEIATGAAHLA